MPRDFTAESLLFNSAAADALAYGYNIGFFKEADLARWADRQIEQVESPPIELIELSMNQGADPTELLKMLRRFGQADPSATIATQLGMIGELLTAQFMDYDAAMSRLWALYYEKGISDEQHLQIACLDEDYLLTADGCGSMAEVAHSLREFVAPYARQLAADCPELVSLMQRPRG